MHFALPPRKTSNPAPYLPRQSRRPILPTLRRTRLKLIALAGLAFVALIYLLTRGSSRSSGHGGKPDRIPSGNPPAVLVTVLDEGKYSKGYLEMVKENRKEYAERHGMLRHQRDRHTHGI